jgi:hypothetical protein
MNTPDGLPRFDHIALLGQRRIGLHRRQVERGHEQDATLRLRWVDAARQLKQRHRSLVFIAVVAARVQVERGEQRAWAWARDAGHAQRIRADG